MTNAQYEQFLALGTSITQPAGCSGNSSYAPETSPGDCPTLPYDPGARPDHPVSCIDWCDAYAYCAWAGKRLCGAIDGGAVPWGSGTDHQVSQWKNICSLNGARAYPYGNSQVSGRCNDLTSPLSGAYSVGGFPQCTSSWPGEAAIADLSGNVQEWENSCNGSAAGSSCAARGGDWLSNDSAVSCNGLATASRLTRSHRRGFRCCWDPE